MAFTPITFDEGKNVLMKCANSTTITKGDALVDNGSGYLTTASAGGNVDVRYVALETVTTTSTGQEVLCIGTEGTKFLADCDAAWARTDIGTVCDLAAAGQVDPNATTDNIFYLEDGVGVAGTGTQVIGYFNLAVPNS